MSDALVAQSPAAGWYSDPSEPSVLRYWDGFGWTHHLQPAPAQVETASNPGWLTNRSAIVVVLALLVLATIIFG